MGAVRSQILTRLLPHLPRAFWRLLPGTSARFGPPRRWQSWAGYLREHPSHWVPLFPERTGEFGVPFWPPAGRPLPFAEGRRFHWLEQGVARLEHARVVSVHGWCVAPTDTFLGDFCFGGNVRDSFVYSLTLQQPPRRLEGVTLNLCSAHAAVNFCHWLLDAVGRLALVERAGIAWPSIDQVLLPLFPGETARWVRATLGLTGPKLIFPGQRAQFRCDQLLQPSFPGFVAAYPPWVVEFYRQHFPAPPVARHRRLYVPRRGKRGLTNEAAVEARLRELGFEEFEPAHQTQLHEKLADVSHVVGVHGAALANLVFCRPGTRVLELLPSDLWDPYYYSLCDSGRMPYGVLVGKSTRQRRRRHAMPTHAPFTIPLDEFDAALASLLGDEPSASASEPFTTAHTRNPD